MVAMLVASRSPTDHALRPERPLPLQPLVCACVVSSCRPASPRAFFVHWLSLDCLARGGDEGRPFTVRLGDGESLLQLRPLGQLQFHADAKMVWLIRRFHWLRALTSERHPACVPDWRVTRQTRWTPSAHRTSPPRCYRRYSPTIAQRSHPLCSQTKNLFAQKWYGRK